MNSPRNSLLSNITTAITERRKVFRSAQKCMLPRMPLILLALLPLTLSAEPYVIDNFGNPTDTTWRFFNNSASFLSGTDQGRTVWYSSDPTKVAIAQTTNPFGPLNVSAGDLVIRQGLRFTAQSVGDIAQTTLFAQPIVVGEIASVYLYLRHSGVAQLTVNRYTDTFGNASPIVNVYSASQNFGTAYLDVVVTRHVNGTWTVGRSDTGAVFITATEATIATGSHLDTLEMRNFEYQGTPVCIYRDFLEVSLFVETAISENFVNPTDTFWRFFAGSASFLSGTDQGRTVWYSSDPTKQAVAQTTNGFSPIDVSKGELELRQGLRFTVSGGDVSSFSLFKKSDQPIVVGEIASVQVYVRGYGNSQLTVNRYIDTAGNTSASVNASFFQNFGTSYVDVVVRRNRAGVWTLGREDTGAVLLTATESTVATGSHLNAAEFRNAEYHGSTVGIYRDYLELKFYKELATPSGLPSGVTRQGNTWYLVNSSQISSVNAFSGMVQGIATAQGFPMVRESYDIYVAETTAGKVDGDERYDVVQSAQSTGTSLTLVCQNPAFPGVTISKTYEITPVLGVPRILAKKVTISGSPGVKTLFSLISRTHFDSTYRSNLFYTRVKAAGTLGDFNTIPATGFAGAKTLYYLFNVGAAANLCASRSVTDPGLGQYFFKADGQWVIPGGMGEDFGLTYGGDSSYFTDTGWDMAWFATFVSTTPHTGEMRYHLFTGDRTTFHQEYRDLPERIAALNDAPVSPLVAKLRYNLCFGPSYQDVRIPSGVTAQTIPFYYPRLRSDEVCADFGTLFRDVWYGDYPSGNGAVLHTDYPSSSPTTPATSIKDPIAAGLATYPRILSGWYGTPQNISFNSNLVTQHPEFFLKDKLGANVPSGWSTTQGMATFGSAYQSLVIGRMAAQLDYFNMKMLFLDSAFGYPWVDWGNGLLRWSDPLLFFKQLRTEVHNRNGLYYGNPSTFEAGLYDISNWEGFASYNENGMPWRDCVEPLMMRRIYQRDGTVTVPLYWKGGDAFGADKNYRDYTNLVLSHLFRPTGCMHDPYNVHFANGSAGTDWVANMAHSAPYFDTSTEYAGSVWKDADVQPCWWRDASTPIEVYAFQQGACYLLTTMKHDPNAANIKVQGVYLPSPDPAGVDTTLSADCQKLGLDVAKRTFVWQFLPRDPDKAPWYPRAAGMQNLPNWDKLFDSRTCGSVAPNTLGARISITLTALKQELTRLAVVTQVPAVFSAIEGKQTNLLMPGLLGASLSGSVNESAHVVQLTVTADKGNNTVLVWWPTSWSTPKAYLDGVLVTSSTTTFGSERFAQVTVSPVGTHTLVVQEN